MREAFVRYGVFLMCLFATLALACEGADGPEGATGPTGPAGTKGEPGASPNISDIEGTVLGLVSNELTQSPVADATITITPGDLSLTTTEQGIFSVSLMPGYYLFVVEADYFEPVETSVFVPWDDLEFVEALLTPESNVVVEMDDVVAAPGTEATLEARVRSFDGSTVESVEWEQTRGVALSLDETDAMRPTVTMAELDTYKDALVTHIVPSARPQVIAVDPHSLELAATAEFEVTITTSSGVYQGLAEVTAKLPFTTSAGIANVPVGVPVLLQGDEADSYDWSIVSLPTGAMAEAMDSDTRWPFFTPDHVGFYTIRDSVSGFEFEIAAGEWAGGITGLDANGDPEMGNCTTCHNNVLAPRGQFDAWKQSGHAHIFSQNINEPGHHWSMNCAGCHTVGFNYDVANNGFDDLATFEGWVVPEGEPNNYAEMLEQGSGFEGTASLANIQCDNCHGPTGSGAAGPAHATRPDLRVSHGAGVCAQCHAEPPRHGRAQQWAETPHANLDLALGQATVESRGDGAAACGRCHSAQGFLAWIAQSNLTLDIQGAAGDATELELAELGLTRAQVEPIACSACHMVHDVGTFSGEPNDAKLRVHDEIAMLPAGFGVQRAGNGALCMMCHNSRRGLHNDFVASPSGFNAPHDPTQADVFMGQNAYFVLPGLVSAHTYIQDTCTNCHMRLTDPPEEYSYQGGGTNHTFRASVDICGNCHGAFDGEGMVAAFDESLDELERAIGGAASLRLRQAEAVWVRAFDEDEERYSSGSSSDANVLVEMDDNRPQTVEVVSSHGQITLVVELTEEISITWADGETTQTDVFGVQLRALKLDDGGAPGDLVFTTDGNFFRAAWNLMLLESDGSHGIHNPTWSMEVIRTTMQRDLSF